MVGHSLSLGRNDSDGGHCVLFKIEHLRRDEGHPILRQIIERGCPGSRLFCETGEFINYSNSGRVDENSIPLSLIDDFRIACYELYAGFGGGIAHRGHYRPQRRHLEAFFENESSAEVKGSRTAHGKIIDCAVYREIADIPSWEHQRADNE